MGGSEAGPRASQPKGQEPLQAPGKCWARQRLKTSDQDLSAGSLQEQREGHTVPQNFEGTEKIQESLEGAGADVQTRLQPEYSPAPGHAVTILSTILSLWALPERPRP